MRGNGRMSVWQPLLFPTRFQIFSYNRRALCNSDIHTYEKYNYGKYHVKVSVGLGNTTENLWI